MLKLRCCACINFLVVQKNLLYLIPNKETTQKNDFKLINNKLDFFDWNSINNMCNLRCRLCITQCAATWIKFHLFFEIILICNLCESSGDLKFQGQRNPTQYDSCKNENKMCDDVKTTIIKKKLAVDFQFHTNATNLDWFIFSIRLD